MTCSTTLLLLQSPRRLLRGASLRHSQNATTNRVLQSNVGNSIWTLQRAMQQAKLTVTHAASGASSYRFLITCWGLRVRHNPMICEPRVRFRAGAAAASSMTENCWLKEPSPSYRRERATHLSCCRRRLAAHPARPAASDRSLPGRGRARRERARRS